MRSVTSSGRTPTRVPHPEGRLDPEADIEAVEAELMLADLGQAEGRLARVVKQAASGDPEAGAEREWLERVIEALGRGEAVRSVPVPDTAAGAPERLQALTSKPVLYVANVDEGVVEVPEAVSARRGGAAPARSRSQPGSSPSSRRWTVSRPTRCATSWACRPRGSSA